MLLKEIQEDYQKLADELKETQIIKESISSELLKKDQYIAYKEKELDELKQVLSKSTDERQKIENLTATISENFKSLQNIFIVKLKDLENFKRKEKKKILLDNSIRLGKPSVQRTRTNIIEGWEDGEDFIQLNLRRQELKANKEKVEKQLRKFQKFIKKELKDASGERKEITEEIDVSLIEQRDFLFLEQCLIARVSCKQRRRIALVSN